MQWESNYMKEKEQELETRYQNCLEQIETANLKTLEQLKQETKNIRERYREKNNEQGILKTYKLEREINRTIEDKLIF